METVSRSLFGLVFIYCCLSGVHSLRGPCGSAASCCACVRTPGCSWFYSAALTQPFCSSTPTFDAVLNESMRVRTPEHSLPVYIIHRNAPFSNRRQISPQAVQLEGNPGNTHDVYFKVRSRSRNVRLRIIGPHNGPRFDIDTVTEQTCEGGVLRSSSSSGGRRGGRNRRQRQRPRRINVECRTEGPGEMASFLLRVTFTSCYEGSKVIRVSQRSPGQRSMSLRVFVKPKCECPCAGSTPSPQVATGSPGEVPSNCTQTCLPSQGEQTSVCGLPLTPFLCRPGASLPQTGLCSGHGTCVCDECVCDPVDPATPHRRYSGRTCECNNYDCPVSEEGQLCGGTAHGVCQCGQCLCRPGWSGDACQCSTSEASCPRNANTGMVCSGHGQCVCGACQCEDLYSGHACECSSQSCPRSSYGLVCGGPDRGMCVCGQCSCVTGYSGSACDIDTDTALNNTESPCSGRGVLTSGVCVCQTPYTGERCEFCPLCESQCHLHRACVACRVFPFLEQQPICLSCRSTQNQFAVFQPTSALDDVEGSENLCVFYVNFCTFEFSYQVMTNGTTVVRYRTSVMKPDGTMTPQANQEDCSSLPVASVSSGGNYHGSG